MASGIFTIVLLFINYRTNLKHTGFDLAERGVILPKGTLMKTILLAITAACATFAIVFFADYFFNTNFQFWAVMFRAFDADKVPIMLCALPLFLMFYIPNSIACHSFRYNEIGKGGWVNTLIIAFFNAASIIYIELVQYSVFFATGQPYWHVESFDRQLGGWLLGTVVVMFVTPWIARKIYKETRNPYLGGILKRAGGKTFRQLLNERRIHEAKLRIQLHVEESIQSIAAGCGFPDSNYFCSVFKKLTGCAPTVYRKRFQTSGFMENL